jgi:hypothetical protein
VDRDQLGQGRRDDGAAGSQGACVQLAELVRQTRNLVRGERLLVGQPRERIAQPPQIHLTVIEDLGAHLVPATLGPDPRDVERVHAGAGHASRCDPRGVGAVGEERAEVALHAQTLDSRGVRFK